MIKNEVRFKLSDSQKDKLLKKANALGMKKNAYCKSLVLKELNNGQ